MEEKRDNPYLQNTRKHPVKLTRHFKIFDKAIPLMLFALSVVNTDVIAQQDTTKNEEVTVVSAYEPTVNDAFKLNISPKLSEDESEKPDIKYSVISKNIDSRLGVNPIMAAKIAGESAPKLYKNYVKLGFATTLSPYLDFYASMLRSKKSGFGVHIKHFSSAAGIKGYAYPGSGETEANIYGRKFGSRHAFSTELFYKQNRAHFYGFRPDDFPEITLSKKDIRQTYNLLGVKTLYESTYNRSSALHHSLKLNYYYLWDGYNSSEHNLFFNADIHKKVSFFNFSKEQKLGIEAGADLWFNNDSIINENTGIVSFTPYYDLKFSQYGFHIGADVALQMDSSVSVHVYPVVTAEVQVIRSHLVAYAGIKGELQKNSMKSFSDDNVFIISTIEKRFTNYKLGEFVGLKGSVGKYFDYNLMFVNFNIEDMPFFVSDTVSAPSEGLTNKFSVVYDNVRHSSFIADFGFHYKNKFNAIISGKYHNYTLDNLEYAWHKPNFEFSLMMDYNMQDKFLIKAELFSFSKMYAPVYQYSTNNAGLQAVTQVAEEIKGAADLNLGVEYRYSKVLSGFVNFNNILNQRYYKFYNYPSYRFNLMLGITYSF